MSARETVERLALENSWECEWAQEPPLNNPPVTWKFQKQELAQFARALTLHLAGMCKPSDTPRASSYDAGFQAGIEYCEGLIKSFAGELT